MIDDPQSLIDDRSGSGGRNEGRSQGTEENNNQIKWMVDANSSSNEWSGLSIQRTRLLETIVLLR